MRSSRWKPGGVWGYVALLLVVTSTLFGITVRQRAPWFGHATYDMAGLVTATGVAFVMNWHPDGPWHAKFGYYFCPKSIETPTFESRRPYVSYPPGSVGLVYLEGMLLGIEPGVPLMMGHFLWFHFWVSFLLGTLAFFLVRRMQYSALTCFLFSCIPIVLYLWLPTPFHEQQMWATFDLAIMPFFVLYIFLEVARIFETDARRKRALSVAMGALAFYGILTDWLFGFLVFCLYLVYAVRGDLTRKPKVFILRSVLFWAPVVAGLLLFVIQVSLLHRIDDVINVVFRRIGIPSPFAGLADGEGTATAAVRTLTTFSLEGSFWGEHVPKGFGPLGIPLAGVSLAALGGLLIYLLAERLRGRPVSRAFTVPVEVIFLTLAPCFLHYYVLRGFNVDPYHLFAALKLAVPLALVPFVLLPAMAVAGLLPESSKRFAWRPLVGALVAGVILASASAYVYALGDERRALFGERNLDHEALAQFIAKHTAYEDVVFFVKYPQCGAIFGDEAPHITTISKKVLHYLNSIEDIYKVVGDIPGEYVVNIGSKGDGAYEKHPGLAPLAEKAYEKIDEGDRHLLKIRKGDFLPICQEFMRQRNLLRGVGPPAAK